VRLKQRQPLVVYVALGVCLCAAAFSRPLWRVDRPTDSLGMGFGTFLEFLGNLPRALENLWVPQKPETILTILPTVYLWENVRTTLIVLAAGTAIPSLVWCVRRWGQPRLRRCW
jgi:hypothetical protein